MQVFEIMKHNVQTIPAHATVYEAAQKMVSAEIGFLPVMDADQMIGVVTERDLMERAFAGGWALAQVPVREVMTHNVVWCLETETIAEATRKMMTHQIRRMPVLDQTHRLVGVIGLADVLTGDQLRQLSESHLPEHA